MTMHGDLAFAGIQWTDLLDISERVIVLSVIVTFSGSLLRALASKSIGLMLTLVVGVSVICSLLVGGVIAWLMMGTTSDRDVMLDLMSIAGLAGFAWRCSSGGGSSGPAMSFPRRCTNVAESGVYVAPQMTLPAELASSRPS